MSLFYYDTRNIYFTVTAFGLFILSISAIYYVLHDGEMKILSHFVCRPFMTVLVRLYRPPPPPILSFNSVYLFVYLFINLLVDTFTGCCRLGVVDGFLL